MRRLSKRSFGILPLMLVACGDSTGPSFRVEGTYMAGSWTAGRAGAQHDLLSAGATSEIALDGRGVASSSMVLTALRESVRRRDSRHRA